MSLNELFIFTLNNAAKYLGGKIDSRRKKTFFDDAINHINSKIYFENLEDLEVFLVEKIEILKEMENGWWNLKKYSGQIEYEIKAYELALDICSHFVKRFVTGSSNNTHIS